jgi:hypothetical protein
MVATVMAVKHRWMKDVLHHRKTDMVHAYLYGSFVIILENLFENI